MAVSEVTAAIAAVLPLLFIGLWALRRWRYRNHVWADIELTEGKSVRRRYKPNRDGALDTEWGIFFAQPHAATMFRNKPLFRFKQGDLWPIRYDMKKVYSENPGEIVYVANPERVGISGKSLSVYMKQKLFADAYARSVGLILLLIIGFGFLGLLILGLYARMGQG